MPILVVSHFPVVCLWFSWQIFSLGIFYHFGTWVKWAPTRVELSVFELNSGGCFSLWFFCLAFSFHSWVETLARVFVFSFWVYCVLFFFGHLFFLFGDLSTWFALQLCSPRAPFSIHYRPLVTTFTSPALPSLWPLVLRITSQRPCVVSPRSLFHRPMLVVSGRCFPDFFVSHRWDFPIGVLVSARGEVFLIPLGLLQILFPPLV